MKNQFILPCMLISAMAFSQNYATGYVFHDANKNLKKENRENGRNHT